MRIVDAEDADAAVDPELEDGAELVPEAAPVGGLEVERVDVLILLGRVLGVLDGAVGAVEEPVGVLLDPGVVGRALEGDVEGQLHAVGVGGGDEAVEVGEGAELGMDGLVAAFGRANGPGAAFVVRALVEACCWGLCGRRGRWDGWAAGRGCRSPWRRSRAGAVRHRRRCRGGLGPARMWSGGRIRTNWRSGRARDRPRGASSRSAVVAKLRSG